MPNRVFSDAAWTSDKVKALPEDFRAEYAWIYSLALCDGTFECDTRKIWAQCYAPTRKISGKGGFTVERVGELLQELVRVGLLLTQTDAQGKTWGYWVGSEKFLPPRAHWHKYKRGKGFLFTGPDAVQNDSGIVTEESRKTSSIGLGVGLGSGLGRGIGPEAIASAAVGHLFEETLAEQEMVEKPAHVPTQFIFVKGRYPGTDPKKIFAHISRAWVRVRGEAAVCRYPSKYPEQWERLCDAHSGDILVPAFELWASKHGYNTEWPITEFLKVAGDFMQQIVPLKDVKPKISKDQVESSAAVAKAQHETLWTTEEAKSTEPGPEAF
jgi:hypothetical protein